MNWDTLLWILGIALFVAFLIVMMRGCGGMMGGMGGCGMGPRMERRGSEHDDQAAATTYTCPMHPETKQDHAGTCPKCGMALVPQQ